MVSNATTPKERDGWLVGSAWGVFLIGLGGVWLAENLLATDIEGLGLFWAGAVMLGLNAVRYVSRLRMSRFTLALGTVLAAVGATRFAGLDLPLVPVLLIVVGAVLLADALLGGRAFKHDDEDYAAV